jgi:hypothetical protein
MVVSPEAAAALMAGSSTKKFTRGRDSSSRLFGSSSELFGLFGSSKFNEMK